MGTERKCLKCDQPAIVTSRGKFLCVRHHRFKAMIAKATWNRKTIPTEEYLERVFAKQGMVCPDCDCTMLWSSKSQMDRVMSLQHYRSGEFGLVCVSCNSRHRDMPEDTYCDMPKDHKRCPDCGQIKPFADFGPDKFKTGRTRVRSRCKRCSSLATINWQRRNPDKVRQYKQSLQASK